MADKPTPQPTQQTAAPAKRFRVTVPNADFSEKVAGVVFSRGRAVVDVETIDKDLGRTPEEIAHMMKHDFGYEVQEI